MTAIQPVENELSKMIERDFYRTTLASISQKYEAMQTFINNLGQDISSIDDFLTQLERDAEQGFDVGSSQETLLFQRSTLQIDLDFYQRMKTAYVRKIFEDLHNFTNGIVKAAVEIEANPMGQSDEEIRERKLGGVRAFESDGDYTIADVYSLLNVTERNLFELGSDIASFSVKITDAQAKQDRGFAVGNLLVNLESQRTKLTLEFKGYVLRIHQFLEQNKHFADRCLNRVKMISGEIVTDKEMQDKQEAEAKAAAEAAVAAVAAASPAAAADAGNAGDDAGAPDEAANAGGDGA